MSKCLTIKIPLAALPEIPNNISNEIIAPLLDPVKVETLKGDRPANARLYKTLYWLEIARKSGGEVSAIIECAAQVSAE
jgi:hypothetical protein